MPKIEKKEKELPKKESKILEKKNTRKSTRTSKINNQNKKSTASVSVKSTRNKKEEKKRSNHKKNDLSKKASAIKKILSKKDILQEHPERVEQSKKFLQEYYDLPYRYNETVVKILAQTPKRLFVYWDVSDKDKQRYINAFGEDFFEKTYPVLLIHNEEFNYTFEVPINDFANSWYLDINDSKSKYVVQLGRKFRRVDNIEVDKKVIEKENINFQNDFLYITDSNKLEAPNDHILFERLLNHVTYRNLKDGSEFNKEISNIVDKFGQTYMSQNIQEMYKALYGDEFDEEKEFEVLNPGSINMPSSGFRK